MQESPDYTMDEFDEINPFGDEFRPDAPTPAPSPEPSPPPTPPLPPTPPPSYQEVVDGDDFPLPPPQLMEEKSTRKEWGIPGPVEPEYPHESILLQTANRLITQYGSDPNYRVKKKDSPFHNYSIKDLKKARDEIYAKRRVTKESLSKRLQERKQRLKSTPPRKREIPPTSLETSLKEAVESRRPSLDHGDEDFFPEEQRNRRKRHS